MVTEGPVRPGKVAVPAAIADDEGAEIRRWLAVAANSWAILVVGAVAGGLLGLLAASRTAPLYEAAATAVVTPPTDPSSLFTSPGLRALYTSPAMAADVVRELQLDAPPHSLTAARFLSQAFSVEDIPNTYLIRVKVRLTDPQIAAKAAALATDHLIELTARVWQDTLKHRRADLERQVEQARLGLAKAEQDWLAARVKSSGTALDVPRALPSRRTGAGTTAATRTLDERLAESRKRGAALAEAERRSGAPAERPESRLGQAYSQEFELVRLENEVELRRELYMALGGRLEQARIELESAPRPLQLVEPPLVPDQALPGTRRRTVAVGLLAGLVLAGCIVVAREWRGQTRA